MNAEKELDKLKKDLMEKKVLIKEKESLLEEKKRELEEKDQKIEDYLSHLQRLQADFDNYKKRSQKEMKEYANYANEKLILKIIEVYEDMERALEARKSDESLNEGFKLIYNKLNDILEKEGLMIIKAQGEKFDPFKHEAIMTENQDDYENGFVIEELRKGYSLKSKVIKYSKVKVCKK